jgi:hypothetical protein
MTKPTISTTTGFLVFTCSGGVQIAVARSAGSTSIGPDKGTAYQNASIQAAGRAARPGSIRYDHVAHSF